MTRMNMDVLGISELEWTGMGRFNLDDRCIVSNTVGKKHLEKYNSPHSQQKSPKCKTYL